MAHDQKLLDLGISLGEIKSELEELRKRNKFLEEQNKQLIDALVNVTKPTGIPITNTPYTKCFTCGIEGIVGYVCTRTDCPTAVRC